MDAATAALVDELAAIKRREIELKTRADEIKALLNRSLDFGDKKTVHLFGNRFKATVQAKTAIKWDQDAVERLRGKMTETEFNGLFNWEYKHAGKKILDAYLSVSPFKDDIKASFTEKPLANYYAFESLDDRYTLSPLGD